MAPAALFALLYGWTRRRLTLVAAAVWVAYFLYEQAMRWRILCSGECNIRIDLLALYPALLVLSVAAAVSALRGRRDS